MKEINKENKDNMNEVFFYSYLSIKSSLQSFIYKTSSFKRELEINLTKINLSRIIYNYLQINLMIFT